MRCLCKLRIVFCLLLWGGLSACAGPSALPTDHFFRLPEAEAPRLDQPFLKGTLSIATFSAGGLYNERSLLYVDAEQPLELKRYRYYLWNNVPGNLLQEHLFAFLQDTRAAERIVLFQPGFQTDFNLSGRLGRFERELGNGRDQVHVTINLLLMFGSTLVWEREYSVSAAVKGGAVHDVVEAFGTALQQIYDAFLQDIRKSVSG